MVAEDYKVNGQKSRRFCCKCTHIRVAVSLGIMGIASLALGLATPTIMNKVIDTQLNEGLRLDTGDSQLYSQWQDSQKIPIYMRYFVYNLTNPEEMRNGGPAKVVQFGPYTYLESRVKFDIWFNADRREVRYRQHRTYQFDPTLSVGMDTDVYTTINVPVITIVQQLASAGGVVGWIADAVLKSLMGETMFVTKQVKELLWGYKDTLLTDIMALQATAKKLGIDINLVPTDIFGLQTNDTAADWQNTSQVYTGQYDINNVTVMTVWDGKETLPYWGSKYANMINGTDGYQFHPKIKDDEILPVFVDDLYRSAFLKCTGDVKVHGITLKRFRIQPSLLANAEEDPDAAAFYAFGPRGVLNLTSATGGPIFVTKPHFFDADPWYISNVEGLTPNGDIHDTWLDIEPITGATMNAAKRLQINARVVPAANVAIIGGNVRTMLLPLIWGEEAATVTESLASDFKTQVYLPMNIGKGLNIAGIVVGAVSIAACIVVLGRYYYLKKNNLLSDPEEQALVAPASQNSYDSVDFNM